MPPALIDLGLPASEVCQWYDAGRGVPPPRRLLAIDYWKLLVDGKHHVDALRFAAHLLPKRQSIWWGGLCVWRQYRPSPPSPIADCLQTVFDWTVTPGEEQRRKAEQAGKWVGNHSSAGMVAMAIFMSEGSIAPKGNPEVRVEPRVSQKMIAAAVVLASSEHGPDQIAPSRLDFLNTADEILTQKLILPEPRSPQHA